MERQQLNKTNLFLLRKVPEIKLFFDELKKHKLSKTATAVVLTRFFTKNGDLKKYTKLELSEGYIVRLMGVSYMAFSARRYEFYNLPANSKAKSKKEVVDFSEHMKIVLRKFKADGSCGVEKKVNEYIILLMKANAYCEEDEVIDFLRDSEGKVKVFPTKAAALRCWEIDSNVNKYVGVLIENTEHRREVLKMRR